MECPNNYNQNCLLQKYEKQNYIKVLFKPTLQQKLKNVINKNTHTFKNTLIFKISLQWTGVTSNIQ